MKSAVFENGKMNHGGYPTFGKSKLYDRAIPKNVTITRKNRNRDKDYNIQKQALLRLKKQVLAIKKSQEMAQETSKKR